MGLRLAVILILTAGAAFGQDSLEEALEGFDDDSPSAAASEFDDALAGFDALPEPDQDQATAAAGQSGFLPHWLRVGGRLSETLAYAFAHNAPPPGGVDHRGVSSLRTRIDLEADMSLATGWKARLAGHAWHDAAFKLKGRKDLPAGFLDAYERDAEVGEAYIQGPLAERLDLTLGRQIVVWGRSDQFRVNDLLNPLDNRVPGLTDIEDLRLPVVMIRTDLYAAPWHLGMIVIPERRFDRTPVPGSDFFPGTTAPPRRVHPDEGFGYAGAGLSLTGTFPGWDLSLYTGSVHDARPHVEMTDRGSRLRRSRIRMAGGAASAVFGSWLLKAEAGWFTRLRYTNAPGQTFSALRTMAGVEYAGLADTTLSLEAANSHIFRFDRRLEALPDDRRRNEPATSVRVSRRFKRDTIEVTLVALTFGMDGKRGALQRLQAEYQWTDNVNLTGGLVLYNSGSQSPFRGIGRNDRFFLTLEYHF